MVMTKQQSASPSPTGSPVQRTARPRDPPQAQERTRTRVSQPTQRHREEQPARIEVLEAKVQLLEKDRRRRNRWLRTLLEGMRGAREERHPEVEPIPWTPDYQEGIEKEIYELERELREKTAIINRRNTQRAGHGHGHREMEGGQCSELGLGLGSSIGSVVISLRDDNCKKDERIEELEDRVERLAYQNGVLQSQRAESEATLGIVRGQYNELELDYEDLVEDYEKLQTWVRQVKSKEKEKEKQKTHKVLRFWVR